MEDATILVVCIGVAVGFVAGYLWQRDTLHLLRARNDLLTEMNKGLTDALKDFLDVGQNVDNAWVDNADWWKEK